MTHTLLAVTTPLLAAALLLTACKPDNTPDPTANHILCSTFLKWDTTTQSYTAQLELRVNDVHDSAENEATLVDAIVLQCQRHPNENAQEVAFNLAQAAALIGGN